MTKCSVITWGKGWLLGSRKSRCVCSRRRLVRNPPCLISKKYLSLYFVSEGWCIINKKVTNNCYFPHKLCCCFFPLCLKPELGILSFAHRSCAHLLISLKSIERLWAIHSDRSRKMSDCEQIAQVDQDIWATMSELLRSLMTNERLWEICSVRSW